MNDKVYGFSEEGFRRVQEATRRVLRSPMTGAQRRRQVPVLGGVRSNGGGGGDGTGCCGELIQGVPLEGEPTVCCEGHNQLRVDMGPTIGIKNLWHAGGDVWSTFSDDAEDDNPFEKTCCLDDPPPTPPDPCETEATDEYDVVLDVSTGMITLEARAALNCDPICARWKMVGDLFQCFGSNEFKLQHFSDTANVQLRQCLCVSPVRALSNCTSICNGNPPSAWEVTFPEMTGGGIQPCADTGPRDDALCGAIGGVVRVVPWFRIDPLGGNCVWERVFSGLPLCCGVCDPGTSIRVRVETIGSQLHLAVSSITSFCGCPNNWRSVSGIPSDCEGPIELPPFGTQRCVYSGSAFVRRAGTIPTNSGHCNNDCD